MRKAAFMNLILGIDITTFNFVLILDIPIINDANSFPLKEFASGIYIISLNNGKEKITKKFTITQ